MPPCCSAMCLFRMSSRAASATDTGTAGAFNLVQLIARNMYDTQLFADWIY